MKITSDFMEEVRAVLRSAEESYHQRRQRLEDELESCAAKCADLEAQAAALEGEEAGGVFAEWRTAQQARSFAEGRLRAFLKRHPDPTSYEDEEFRKQVQALDEKLGRCLAGMDRDLDKLHERVVRARADLHQAVADAEALGDEHTALVGLASEVRARLTPEERVALPSVSFAPLFAAFGEIDLRLRPGVGGAYFKNNVMVGRRVLAEKED